MKGSLTSCDGGIFASVSRIGERSTQWKTWTPPDLSQNPTQRPTMFRDGCLPRHAGIPHSVIVATRAQAVHAAARTGLDVWVVIVCHAGDGKQVLAGSLGLWKHPVVECASNACGVTDRCTALYIQESLGNAMCVPSVGLVLLATLVSAETYFSITNAVHPCAE